MNEIVAPTMDSLDALYTRLEAEHGFSRVDASSAEAFAAAAGDSVILLSEDPRRTPESWDVAVVLPELVKPHAGRLRVGLAMPAASATLMRSFGILRMPALLFQRDGGYVGVIEGMRDWDEFVDAVARRLETPVSRRPGVGIPVSGASGASCH